jgi:hypothetical protein
MARPHESAVQRVQVGVLGLLAVLLFVYIANLILERVVPKQSASPDVARQVEAQPDKPKDEPLAELGVTPVVEDTQEPQPKASAQPAP